MSNVLDYFLGFLVFKGSTHTYVNRRREKIKRKTLLFILPPAFGPNSILAGASIPFNGRLAGSSLVSVCLFVWQTMFSLSPPSLTTI